MNQFEKLMQLVNVSFPQFNGTEHRDPGLLIDRVQIPFQVEFDV